MWDHITRFWHYCSDAAHSRYTKQVAQFKINTLEREKERIKNKHEELRHKLHEFQSRHLERLEDIEQLHYNGQKCWSELERLYLDEAETRIKPIEATIEHYLHGHEGVG
jgi:chromosome segregation ATPase